jgi:hypothetical protein
LARLPVPAPVAGAAPSSSQPRVFAALPLWACDVVVVEPAAADLLKSQAKAGAAAATTRAAATNRRAISRLLITRTELGSKVAAAQVVMG